MAGFDVKVVRPGVAGLFDAETGEALKPILFFCQDCATTKSKWLDYMAIKEVWEATGLSSPFGGILCLRCLRKRLQRDLTRGDFQLTIPLPPPDADFLTRINQGHVPTDAVV